MLRDVLAASGMRLAPAPWQALLSTLFRRAFINLRGLGFRETDPGRIPPQVIIRIHTCWSVAQGLGMVDTIRAAEVQMRHLLLALRAGEPYRVSRALAVEAGYHAIAGGPRRARTQKSFRPTACWPRESSTSTRTPSVWPRWWKAWRHSSKDAGARRVTSTNARKPFCASVVAASPGNSPPHG